VEFKKYVTNYYSVWENSSNNAILFKTKVNNGNISNLRIYALNGENKKSYL